MKENFYDIRNVPFASRESFNNTILLLTMVKTDYYYIVGFDRLKNIIEIAFDLESDFHSAITENVTIDFGSNPDTVLFRCGLTNALADEYSALLTEKLNSEEWSVKEGEVIYELKVKKDTIIPLGINDMNEIILKIRKNVYDFLEDYYFLVINKG